MERFEINGGRKLSGEVRLQSAKNAVLPMIAGALLTNEQVVIKNCPKIGDVFSMLNILQSLGVKTKFEEDNLIIDASTLTYHKISSTLATKLRSSIFILGALISRFGKANICYPGGCAIGVRPIDIHISGLKKLGVKIKDEGGELECKATKLASANIYFDFPSVGATENIILASIFIKGETVIFNPAKEPEVVDFIRFLNSMGANVTGGGSDIIRINGVTKLHGTTYVPMSDRMEAGTFIVATAITGGEIQLSNCNIENFLFIINKICDNTCKMVQKNDIMYYKSGGRINGLNIDTGPHPAFPTDLQAPMTALCSVANGTSVITENVFEMRFNHVPELIKMGADIKISSRNAIIRGVERLHGATVNAVDLRGGASLVLAGLNAEGKTTVLNPYHVERGYQDIVQKLKGLSADIVKIID